MPQVAVIGAGPAGSYAGYLLTKSGYDVTIYEDSPKIGVPVQCTGIVTKRLFDLIDYDEQYIVNKLSGVEVIGPKNEKVSIPLKEYVICRIKFDNFVANKARDAGAQVFTGHKYVGKEGSNILIKHDGETRKVNADILIGADGPLSSVAKTNGMWRDRKFIFGLQATVKANFNPDIFTTWFGSLAPGFFAWSVPESATVSRVGVGTQSNARAYFDKLVKMLGGTILEHQAGPIPIYNGNQAVAKDNVFLVGDAAGLCKDTTGGGIITGMHSSKILADSIINNNSYPKQLKKLRFQLWLHAKLRNMLNNFSDKDYASLIRLMSSERVQSILYEHPRDYPSTLLAKLALAEPRFLMFGRHAIN